MHFEKFRSLFTKTQPNLQDGKAAPDIESSKSRAASTGLKAPHHTGQPGLILLNPDYLKSNGAGSTETYALDIVAIHGITGDAFKTWTHANGTNWLRDFIPNAFPGARVFSFGYPAEVFWSRSDGDIDSFARSLLEGLKRERRELKVNLPLDNSKRYQDVSIWLHPTLLTCYSIDLGVLCLSVTVWEVLL